MKGITKDGHLKVISANVTLPEGKTCQKVRLYLPGLQLWRERYPYMLGSQVIPEAGVRWEMVSQQNVASYYS